MHRSPSARDTISCAAGFSVLFDVLTCVLILCPLVADFVLYQYDERALVFWTLFLQRGITTMGALLVAQASCLWGDPGVSPLFASMSLSVLSALGAP